MANYERFTPQEIPYEILERFGLTREMIDDLPQNVMQPDSISCVSMMAQ